MDRLQSPPDRIVRGGPTGPVADGDMAPDIHQALSDKDLLPKVHLLGTGYIDAKLLAQSKQDHRIDLVGPTRPDYKWQARAEKGLDAGSFDINWERKVSTCPGVARLSVGRQRCISIPTRHLRSSSRSETVNCVSVVCAARWSPAEQSTCVVKITTWHWKQFGHERNRESLLWSMPREQGLRAPSLKECVR